MSTPLEDLALVGGLHSSVLIGPDGTVEWGCLPRPDSAAVFAKLLGTKEHGVWYLGPVDADSAALPATHRRYRGDSLVVESIYDTADGTVRVLDFMPVWTAGAPVRLVRIVEAITGRIRVRSELLPRYGYGRTAPRISRHGKQYLLAPASTAQADAPAEGLWLSTTARTSIRKEGGLRSDVIVSEGERLTFTATWASVAAPPPTPDALHLLAQTETYWTIWASWMAWAPWAMRFGPYQHAVMRSLLTLKALTHAPTGAILAAPTTSLPELIGGARNWDYRYCWLRDAALILDPLLRAGFQEEARDWIAWLLRAVAGDPENLQIMYGIDGERELDERELPWLPGYEDSRPVRVGNGAAGQLQLDVYGEVVEVLHLARRSGLPMDDEVTAFQLRLVEWVEKHWDEPDEGIWEVRGPRRHFVHSKVMTWVAVDRTVKLIEFGDVDGPLQRWKDLRETIHRDVCEKGYDKERNTFTQSYGSRELDAALLLIPVVDFLPADDKRVIGTIEAIQRELSTEDGLVLRYSTSAEGPSVDGLEGDEGAFLACSFWLVEALSEIGRVEEADALFRKLLSLRNDLGLFAEEWDSRLQRQVGNFPQGLSHAGLVGAALALHQATIARAQADGAVVALVRDGTAL